MRWMVLFLSLVGCAHTPQGSRHTLYGAAQLARWKFPAGGDQDGALGALGFRTEDEDHRMRVEVGGGRIEADSSDRTNLAYALLEGDGKISPARVGDVVPFGGAGFRYLALGDDETPAAAALGSLYGHLGLDWTRDIGRAGRLHLLVRGGVSFYNRGQIKDSFGEKSTSSSSMRAIARGELGWDRRGLSLRLFYDFADYGSEFGELALAGLSFGYRW